MNTELLLEIDNLTTGQYFKVYENGRLEGFGSRDDVYIFNNYTNSEKYLLIEIGEADIDSNLRLSTLAQETIAEEKITSIKLPLEYEIINTTTGKHFLFFREGTHRGFGANNDKLLIVNHFAINRILNK